jgi:CRISPR/Cas system CSM-associated protein Csm3 (group 7 of RAMP superfamily)
MPWKIEMPLQLVLTTPLHTGTGAGLAGYLDAGTLLDHEGYPYIAGSTLKGRLRYYLYQLLPTLEPVKAQQQAIMTTLFGVEGMAGSLFFDNLVLSDAWRNLFNVVRSQAGELRPLLTQPRTNVTLSRLRGIALEQRLFTVETVPAHFSFIGAIHGSLAETDRILTIAGVTLPRDLVLLVAACRTLTHLGGRKSRGLGRCHLRFAPTPIRVNDAPVEVNLLLEALR